MRAQHEEKKKERKREREREREKEKEENSLHDIIKRAKTPVSLDKVNGVG